MLVNKIGDVSFLFSIAIILYVYGTVDIYELYLLSDLIYIDIYRIVVNTFVAYNVNYMIAFFFFIAAIGKSAQLGLHI
jgi:NADH:ubiquinone oxidoreductase subunit 5 (subunit L)/multisubunit Na+/H+ antiporter MnhA subunit